MDAGEYKVSVNASSAGIACGLLEHFVEGAEPHLELVCNNAPFVGKRIRVLLPQNVIKWNLDEIGGGEFTLDVSAYWAGSESIAASLQGRLELLAHVYYGVTGSLTVWPLKVQK